MHGSASQRRGGHGFPVLKRSKVSALKGTGGNDEGSEDEASPPPSIKQESDSDEEIFDCVNRWSSGLAVELVLLASNLT